MVLNLEVNHDCCHLVPLEFVVVLEVEVVMEVILHLQDLLSMLEFLEVVECYVRYHHLSHPSCKIPQ